MCKKSYRINSLILLCAALYFQILEALQPPYQVSLYLNLPVRGQQPIHFCNGVIIQSRLILTTASCVHYPNQPIPIQPFMISVVAGNSDALSNAPSFDVAEVMILPRFNFSTTENDLAILRLDKQLPLNLRKDMKWIILDDADDLSGRVCDANFHRSSDSVDDEEIKILKNDKCNQLGKERSKDICADYELPDNFNCKSSLNLISYDRGTGLVCKGHLAGLLSTILWANDNEKDDLCEEDSVKAFYVNLIPHLDWIYTVIAIEEFKDISQGANIASKPYNPATDILKSPDNGEEIGLGGDTIFHGTSFDNGNNSSNNTGTSTHTKRKSNNSDVNTDITGNGNRVYPPGANNNRDENDRAETTANRNSRNLYGTNNIPTKFNSTNRTDNNNTDESVELVDIEQGSNGSSNTAEDDNNGVGTSSPNLPPSGTQFYTNNAGHLSAPHQLLCTLHMITFFLSLYTIYFI